MDNSIGHILGGNPPSDHSKEKISRKSERLVMNFGEVNHMYLKSLVPGLLQSDEGNAAYFKEKFNFELSDKRVEICTYENCEIKAADLLRLTPYVF